MATYVNDAIWRRLSEYYNVTPRQAQVGDLYKRWLDEKGLNWGSAGDYFISQFPGSTRGDAEWLFWTGGFGDDLVLLLDASMEPQTGTAPQWVLNRADTRVPSARVGSSGRAELRGVYHGLLLPGAVSNSASVPLAASTSVDVCVRVQMFASSGLGEMISKWGASGSWGWTLRQNGANVDAIVSSNGSNLYASVSVAHGMSIGDSAWFRLSYDRLNGRLAVWRADDQDQVPDRWTLLGQTLVTPANIFANATNVTFGVTGANVNPFNGAIKRGVVRSDVDGAVVLDVDFTAATPLASSFVCSTGQTVTVTAATGVDSNDPVFLQHTGTNYLYLPGAAGNNLTMVSDTSNAFTTEVDYIVRMDRLWSGAGTNGGVIGRYGSSSGAHVALGSSNGTVNFTLHDGTNYVGVTCSAQTSGEGARWLRVTWRSSDGRVQFFFNADQPTVPTVWTQLGVDATLAAGATITQSAVEFFIGGSASTGFAPTKVLYASAAKTIGGVPTVLVDTSVITNGNQTSFTATTGQTVTINRSTSGKKSAAVVRPVWLFGTNSYLEIVDNTLLDFGANDSFTVIGLSRNWDTFNANVVGRKRTITADLQGWALRYNSTKNAAAFLDDNPTSYNVVGPAIASGAIGVSALVVDRRAGTGTVFLDGVAGTPVVLGSFGSLENASNFEVGRNHTGASYVYSDMELLAVAVIRRALTATELQNIGIWFQNRKW